MSTEDLYLS